MLLPMANCQSRLFATEVAKKYADRNPDLANLCLIRMSELHPCQMIITVDMDFRVYRRNRREAIPVQFPPSLLA